MQPRSEKEGQENPGIAPDLSLEELYQKKQELQVAAHDENPEKSKAARDQLIRIYKRNIALLQNELDKHSIKTDDIFFDFEYQKKSLRLKNKLAKEKIDEKLYSQALTFINWCYYTNIQKKLKERLKEYLKTLSDKAQPAQAINLQTPEVGEHKESKRSKQPEILKQNSLDTPIVLAEPLETPAVLTKPEVKSDFASKISVENNLQANLAEIKSSANDVKESFHRSSEMKNVDYQKELFQLILTSLTTKESQQFWQKQVMFNGGRKSSLAIYTPDRQDRAKHNFNTPTKIQSMLYEIFEVEKITTENYVGNITKNPDGSYSLEKLKKIISIAQAAIQERSRIHCFFKPIGRTDKTQQFYKLLADVNVDQLNAASYHTLNNALNNLMKKAIPNKLPPLPLGLSKERSVNTSV